MSEPGPDDVVAPDGGTVGVVLVSHSVAIAEATAELAVELAGGAARVVPAGGTAEGAAGTSIDRIRSAVQRADTGHGVVLLMDMGSSVLTARTLVMDLEDEPGAPQVRLADAPFVEGAVAATVLAAAGGGLDEVVGAAEQGRGLRKL